MDVPIRASTGSAANNDDKKVIFKNYAPFTYFISERNNLQVANGKDIDVVMLIYNLM